MHFASGDDALVLDPSSIIVARQFGSAEVNASRLASFTMVLPEEGTGTFFENVRRVPPGHLLIANRPEDHRCIRWHEPDFRNSCRTREEAIKAVDALLDKSIQHSLDGATRPALMLSSGLDSNILLSRLADRLDRLPAFCGAPPRASESAENECMSAAKSASGFPGTDFHSIDGEPTWIEQLPAMFERYERPYYNPGNIGWMDAIYTRAREGGNNTLFHGMLGNFTVSRTRHGELSDAIRRKQWSQVLVSLTVAKRRGWRAVYRMIYTALLDHLPAWLTRLANGRSTDSLATEHYLRSDHEAVVRAGRKEADHGVLPHRDSHRLHLPHEYWRRLVNYLDWGLYRRGIKRTFGLDLVDPYADRALAEFCVSLPAWMFGNGEEDRSLARALIDARIPSQIRDATERRLQGSDWRAAAQRQTQSTSELIAWARSRPRWNAMFDLDALEKDHAKLDRLLGTQALAFANAVTALAFSRWVESR